MVAPISNDSYRVSTKELEDIVLPKATKTWCPLAHHQLAEEVQDRIVDHGLKVHNTTHIVSHGGDRYFGTVELEHAQGKGYRRMVGIRNSNDMKFSASIVAGARVICCDNGMFVGEVLCLARKHTSRLHDDLGDRLDASFAKLIEEWASNDMRIAQYQLAPMGDRMAHDLIIQSTDRKVIASSAIPKVLKEWREPAREEFKPRTAWSLHNAFTEILKKDEFASTVSERTRNLQNVFDTALSI